ncbi:hypothetical protein GV827_15500 [Sulfitobacter sp. JBTF-M27]|uniref:Flavodoxin domain-containing protein n=1 Tax=Sulfitobacter sediminilitoris TaxID=2698830 RepID=A0A6P0CCA3_9RHOB|nr:flavodoxin domain-containing protein [Sulfitobacter sediminilitoris]NEK23802.1 hypothetical protein [Sulfitobacter sediminilitoris]
MNGAIFYATKYGSTGQYAHWIGIATHLPVYNIAKETPDLSAYDFLVLGCPVLYNRLMFHTWAKQHAALIKTRPTILFTVSGAGPGNKLDDWIANSLPTDIILHVRHFALRGRQDPAKLTFFDRTMLIIAGLLNRDRVAARDEMHGFDYMDKSSIAPIVEMIESLK